jgi:hypothetical protein
MSKRPLLIFPQPSSIARADGSPSFLPFHLPTKSEQAGRLGTKMSNLDTVLANETAYLHGTPFGLVSEMILVMEIAGTIHEFFRAVEKTPGMEFLLEYAPEEEREGDEFFYSINAKKERVEEPFKSRLFLTMTNQRALKELQSYWNEYKKAKEEQNFPDGTAKFRTLFERLIDLRPYGVKDRIRDTGLEDYLSDLRTNNFETAKFEIELAFKRSSEQNQSAYDIVVDLLSRNGGKAIEGSRLLLTPIGYHAFIAEAPITCFDELSESSEVVFLKSHQIIFFRPVGQLIALASTEEQASFPTGEKQTSQSSNDAQESRVAILDGLPLTNHSQLTNISVDDPDDFGRNYLSNQRIHGTAMASIVMHGDLSDSSRESLLHPVYLRPILRPGGNNLSSGEYLPDDLLPIDLVHRAVVRIFEGDGDQAPIAPNVKIINFSIGDVYRPFHSNMSTWARLIDWLSHKYDVLFIISTGNYSGDLFLGIPHRNLDATTSTDLERKTIEAILADKMDRRILAPSESVNSLTIGASHFDSSELAGLSGSRKNVVFQPTLFSPISRIGFGYRRSVKPETLMPGGRKLFRLQPIQNHTNHSHLKVETFPVSSVPPGILTATPGNAGDVNKVGYVGGTSASAALASHLGGKILEMLDILNESSAGKVPKEFYTVVTKALLVHGASWGNEQQLLEQLLKNTPSIAPNVVKKHLMAFVGYGCVNSAKALECTDFRVTLIGFGKIKKDKAHVFSFPLPPSISQKKLFKRLTVTLAWLSPINFKSYRYRQSQLYYQNLAHNSPQKAEHISLDRAAYDFDASQSGTVQHDILEAERADAFVIGNTIEIKVNCKEDASGLSARLLTKYALIVTLEVKDESNIPIYEEIEQLIAVPVREKVR